MKDPTRVSGSAATSRHLIIGLLGVCLVGLCAVAFINREVDDSVPMVKSEKSSSEELNRTAQDMPRLVGRQRCAECHDDIAKRHSQSGHAATFRSTRGAEISERLAGTRVTSAAGDEYQYVADDEGLAVGLPGRFGDRLFPLEYVLGSGKHAMTFFTLLEDSSGGTLGVESHHTWFHADNQLHITPGQEKHHPTRDMEYFGKVFRDEQMHRCVDCHTTSATVANGTIENLVSGVHCENCHGPGSQHVDLVERGEMEAALEAIHRDTEALDEITNCGRCHRMPHDIEPQRLERYPNSLVRFQPVGLLQSRCFTESDGALRCSTCHDPHADPTTKTASQHVQTCLQCHDQTATSHCPVSPTENCIDCHMPNINLVRNIGFHDHWIRVRPEEPADKD